MCELELGACHLNKKALLSSVKSVKYFTGMEIEACKLSFSLKLGKHSTCKHIQSNFTKMYPLALFGYMNIEITFFMNDEKCW